MYKKQIISNKNFYINPLNYEVKTYKDLYEDILYLDKKENFQLEKKTYSLFLMIVHSLINDYKLELHEGWGKKKYSTKKSLAPWSDSQNCLQRLRDLIVRKKNKWGIVLKTSGTTGQPKQVEQNYEALTRNVRVGELWDSDVWAFAYNPRHIAGLHVFFQALLNLNTIVDVHSIRGEQLLNAINDYKVTALSATPSFLRLIQSTSPVICSSMNRLTFGGEKFDRKLAEMLKKNFFPKARIKNIYASTEAGSLLASDGEAFQIPEKMKKKIKINSENQILINVEHLGKTFENNKETDWYETGDFVEWTDDKHFRIANRHSEIINVGGYNVNPTHVESVINSVNCVTDSVVYGKPNKLVGNLVCANIQLNRNVRIHEAKAEKIIMDYLEGKLHKWEIPRFINFTKKLELTDTGKKLRL